MMPFSMTLTDPNPVFKVTAFLKSNISEMVCLRDKLTMEHYRKHIQSIEWYYFQ